MLLSRATLSPLTRDTAHCSLALGQSLTMHTHALVRQGSDRFQYKGIVPFETERAKVKDIADMQVLTNAFMLVSQRATLTLSCANEEEKDAWMMAISNQLARIMAAQSSRQATVRQRCALSLESPSGTQEELAIDSVPD